MGDDISVEELVSAGLCLQLISKREASHLEAHRSMVKYVNS